MVTKFSENYFMVYFRVYENDLTRVIYKTLSIILKKINNAIIW